MPLLDMLKELPLAQVACGVVAASLDGSRSQAHDTAAGPMVAQEPDARIVCLRLWLLLRRFRGVALRLPQAPAQCHGGGTRSSCCVWGVASRTLPPTAHRWQHGGTASQASWGSESHPG